MGTRNLTLVQLGGVYKVAQYGQWDGYPGGQGATVLAFLNSLTKKDLRDFTKKVAALTTYTEDELKQVDNTPNWTDKYPHLSRDMGAKILKAIQNGVTKVNLQTDFANDSLFCEWAYVIDLDKGVLEVYEGFNKRKLGPKARFYNGGFVNQVPSYSPWEKPYYPIRLSKSFTFNDLPTQKEWEKIWARH